MIRTKKFKVVYVPGTWDLFHVGHLRILKRAWKLADWVIAGVNTDLSVLLHKGACPIIPFEDRVKILKACRYVDEVVKRIVPVRAKKLKRLGVEVFVLGSDWKGKALEGLDKAIKAGIKVKYFSYTKNISTTEIQRKLKK